MNKFLSQSQVFLKRNAPTILTCLGGIGVVATSVLAVKATPKAMKKIEETKEAKGEDLTKIEIVKAAAPAYIPAILLGASTIACIFGANTVNKRRQASLMSAYALLDTSFKEYKNTVTELYGEEADDKIKAGLAQDKYDEEEDDILVEDGKELFFDMFSNRYFQSTIEDVQRAEYRINRDLVMRDYVSLNEFYSHLGIPTIPAGNELGWSVGGNLACYWQSWIDFSHKKALIDDDMECCIITMITEPIPDYNNYA